MSCDETETDKLYIKQMIAIKLSGKEYLMKKIIVDGVTFVPEEELKNAMDCKKAENFDGMKYCIVRTYSAGVFAGYIESRKGQEIVIRKVRRIWYWDGANSLSQLAKDGTAKPKSCKFAVEVDKIEVLQAIEIIECTEKAQKSITEVAEWKQ